MRQGSQFGIEELNLLEFALGLLDTRPPDGKSTLVFEDSIFDEAAKKRIARKVTIASPTIYGLPTHLDQDVLVGAMQLTWLKNRFESEHVEFSNYELCNRPTNAHVVAKKMLTFASEGIFSIVTLGSVVLP